MSGLERRLDTLPGAFLVGAVATLPMGAVGTQLHELGHVAMARAAGATTALHFASMEHSGPGTPAILAGGLLANCGVGTLGLLGLALRRGRDRTVADAFLWAMALCWSRQLANLLAAAVVPPDRGDEARLELLLAVPRWSIQIGTAAPAVAACVLACAWFGRRRTLPLTAGGVVGSVVGAGVWFGGLGPWLLP